MTKLQDVVTGAQVTELASKVHATLIGYGNRIAQAEAVVTTVDEKVSEAVLSLSYADMAATGSTSHKQTQVSDDLKGGVFDVVERDISTEVAADTRGAYYVPFFGTDGSSGGFVRAEKSGSIKAQYFGMNADGVTSDSDGWQAAVDFAVDFGCKYIDGGGLLYRLKASSTPVGLDINNPPAGWNRHLAVRLPDDSSAYITIRDADFVVEPANVTTDISYAFGNHYTDHFGKLTMRNVSFDLDQSLNTGTAQQRCVGLHNSDADLEVGVFNDGASKNGYLAHLYNGHMRLRATMRNVSGGLSLSWASLDAEVSVNAMNEVIDLDKTCKNCVIRSSFFQNCSECIDSNGTDGLQISDCYFVDSGRHLIINGKENFSTLADQIAYYIDSDLIVKEEFFVTTDVTVSGTIHKGDATSADAFIVIGNSRYDVGGFAYRDYSNGKCCGEIAFSDFLFNGCGPVLINEADGIKFTSGKMKNMTVFNAAGSEKAKYALRFESQSAAENPAGATVDEIAAMDAARDGSKLKVTIRDVEIDGSDYGGMVIYHADTVDIDGLKISGHGDYYAARIGNLETRNTTGSVNRMTVTAPVETEYGIVFSGSSSTGEIIWGTNNEIDCPGATTAVIDGDSVLVHKRVAAPLSDLDMNVSATYVESEVQGIANKLDALMGRLRDDEMLGY